MAIAHARAFERERAVAGAAAGAAARHGRRARPTCRSTSCSRSCSSGSTEILNSDTAAFLLLDETGDELVARGGEGDRGGGRARRADPGRARVRGPDRGRAAGDLDRGRRPRGHPQPDPARARDPLAARRPAARRRPRHRRAARGDADAADLHGRGRGAAAARGRPRGHVDRPRADVPPARRRRGAAGEPRARSGCRSSPGSSWPRATAPRCGAAASAATGTTRSRWAAATSRSWSAT